MRKSHHYVASPSVINYSEYLYIYLRTTYILLLNDLQRVREGAWVRKLYPTANNIIANFSTEIKLNSKCASPHLMLNW